ncbi:hypothetical protein [Streptomyces violarus]|uniref:hypothetical protein n=1 Tax=Streptomyces violarus TaxID=67380 RepID=UPI0021BF24B7|nr:hypothetical protein [Streptomyces violarus]MCT9142930.1 hypothetical protein [Streptomyces violarus]
MRVHLTDGTNSVEITAKGYSRKQLDDIENAAHRMLDSLRSDRPTYRGTTFGFTADDTLDRVALDSNTERAEPYDDGRDQDDEDDDA